MSLHLPRCRFYEPMLKLIFNPSLMRIFARQLQIRISMVPTLGPLHYQNAGVFLTWVRGSDTRATSYMPTGPVSACTCVLYHAYKTYARCTYPGIAGRIAERILAYQSPPHADHVFCAGDIGFMAAARRPKRSLSSRDAAEDAKRVGKRLMRRRPPVGSGE